jgi:hypothetical protein
MEEFMKLLDFRSRRLTVVLSAGDPTFPACACWVAYRAAALAEVISYQLSVISYQLSVISYQLSGEKKRW